MIGNHKTLSLFKVWLLDQYVVYWMLFESSIFSSNQENQFSRQQYGYTDKDSELWSIIYINNVWIRINNMQLSVTFNI